MFEFSLLGKYLIPKKRRLSLALVALVSVGMISLVVWLLLLFFSVTAGVENGWVRKVTTLHAPLRITPTKEYYKSYYYQIDALAENSHFSYKTLKEKLKTSQTDPYDPDQDPTLPEAFIKPDLDENGKVKDLVKLAASILEEESLSFSPYEVGSALLKLNLIQDEEEDFYTQSTLTQACYITALPQANKTFHTLLLAPSKDDFSHLLFLAKHRVETLAAEGTPLSPSPSQEANVALQEILSQTVDCKVRLKHNLGPYTPKTNLSLSSATLSSCLIEAEESGAKLKTPWRALTIESVKPKTSFPSVPETPPPWAYTVQNQVTLPKSVEGRHPILLPKSLKEAGAKIGDTGTLSFQTATLSAVQEVKEEISVAGFYDPGILPIGNRALFAEESLVSKITAPLKNVGQEKVDYTGFQVWTERLQEISKIKKNLEQKFAEKGIDAYWTISSYQELPFAKELLGQFQSDKLLFSLVSLIILIVASSNILSFLILLVSDKKREIALLQALGASKMSILSIFGGCGAVIGLLSSWTGAFLAYLSMKNLSTLLSLLSKLQGTSAPAIILDSIPTALDSKAVLLTLLTTPLLGVIAALIPAIKAIKMQPGETLR